MFILNNEIIYRINIKLILYINRLSKSVLSEQTESRTLMKMSQAWVTKLALILC